LVIIASDIAEHLSRSYGTRALKVAQLAQDKHGSRLHDSYPFLEAEVVYAAQEEMACTTVDVITRRLRLGFLDTEAAFECLPRIIDILAQTLKWDDKRKKAEQEDAKFHLHIMTVGRKGYLGEKSIS